ncbi:MAG: alpha-glucan family phosphorylase [Acidobacteria bacterium]|nr:alpha-glucan family phosphorylase [Acidobacteriota bacterium]
MLDDAGFVPLPDRIPRLPELAYDLWWSWNYQAREVFRRLDYSLWQSTAHNPVLMLRTIEPDRLETRAKDPKFLALYDAALAALARARTATETWWSKRSGTLTHRAIAYFSAEFALHQSLPIYAGGLGVLAGDHCKEASDLGLPLIGVGFMYPQGDFHQLVSAEGWQEERYEQLNWADAPVEPAVTPQGKPCIIAVPLGGRSVLASVWRLRLGRVKLYLLDTDLEENAPWDRGLSARLYAGDRELRIQQEIVLGIGGVRVLRALGSDPFVWHLNEGHAAFVVLQRIRELLDRGSSFDDALEEVRETTVFTTHTPVPAGHDAFPFHLVETHLAGAWGSLGAHRDAFLALGQYDNGGGSMFNMTALALRTAGWINGVSRLHGQVTREMWQPIWRHAPEGRRPVGAVTNGIHVPTWIAAEMSKLFERYLGEPWRDRHDEPGFWEAIDAIPDADLWEVRQALRVFLFNFIRERARQRWTEDQVSAARVVAAGTLLDPAALTIGFARRFTGYKRPELIFHDPDRLARILTARRRPAQIVFAGKAHPADEFGKHHLQRVYRRAVDPAFAGRIAFVDDYDLHVAHFLVQGCDVWLNTPRRPLEASGTSGMKASANGVLHLSIGDGWWAEGYTGSNGWLIDGKTESKDPAVVDAADADALYRLLEEEVVPAFYDRDGDDVPRRWLAMVKQAIRSVTPQFSARRMVKQYAEEMYAPAIRKHAGLVPSS